MKTILAISIIFSFNAFQNLFFLFEKVEMQETPVARDSLLTASICFVGDLMCHSTQFNYARVGADTFDFTGVYSEVKPYLQSANLTIGNLETVIAGKKKGFSGYPYFNAPDDFIYALKDAGFDLLITANNHSLDQGWGGVKRTIDVINKNKIHRTGTYTSQEDSDSIRIFMINSIKVAILAYTEHTNDVSFPKGKDFIVKLIDVKQIENDIKKARSKNVDMVLVHLHYGPEYNREPSAYQKEIVQKTILFGADIIIGGHPHVVQPFDFFESNNSKIDSGFIAYSMGNFISNQRWRYSDAGVILNIQLAKNRFTDSVFISDVNYLPTWVFKGNTENGRKYIILPSQLSESDSVYSYLTKKDKRLMREAFEDTKEIITKYNKKPNLISIKNDEEITYSNTKHLPDTTAH
ncbi:MAG: CapA family protein [Ignavibacteria bacterium]|nr:CapA family protein [Ignavibacteria bacterium]